MGKSSKKLNRILSIFKRLMLGKVIEKEYETGKYGVSNRTIQRDLDDIRAFLAEERSQGEEDKVLVYDKEQKGYVLRKLED